MTGASDKPENRERARRAERLRTALRENLKRRKAQAKARGVSGPSREASSIAPEKPKG